MDVLQCLDRLQRTVVLPAGNWFEKILLENMKLEDNEEIFILAIEDPDIHNRDKDHRDLAGLG